MKNLKSDVRKSVLDLSNQCSLLLALPEATVSGWTNIHVIAVNGDEAECRGRQRISRFANDVHGSDSFQKVKASSQALSGLGIKHVVTFPCLFFPTPPPSLLHCRGLLEERWLVNGWKLLSGDPTQSIVSPPIPTGYRKSATRTIENCSFVRAR